METKKLEDNENIVILLEKYSNFLTKNQIEVLSFRFIEDFSYQEIADILKISKPAAYDAVKKAKQKLNNISKKLHE